LIPKLYLLPLLPEFELWQDLEDHALSINFGKLELIGRLVILRANYPSI